MSKLLLFQGPVSSRSGYGDHTRDLLKSIIELGKFDDIKVVDMRWGDCPKNGITAMDSHLLNYFFDPTQPLPKRPDVFVQVSVPNEFNPIGEYNIGITAGMETTAVSAPWIEGCNRMDLIIVPSEHSRQSLVNCIYDRVDEKTKQKTGTLRVEKPVEVLFEGANTDVFFKTNDCSEDLEYQMKNVKEDFCFLHVGHWLAGAEGHSRKDTAGMIKTFCETFKNTGANKRPALLLKTSSATFSVIDREMTLRKIRNITEKFGPNCPSVYLIHGDLSPQEMNQLYNHTKVKVHLSFTKGEGFGRPLLEASISGKPVIAPNWSGQVDFLTESILLPGDLRPVHKSAQWKDVIIPESKWFYVNYGYASKVLKEVFKNYKNFIPKARKQARISREEFNLSKMNEGMGTIIDKYVQIKEQVSISLPKLQKVGKKIELPTLQPVR